MGSMWRALSQSVVNSLIDDFNSLCFLHSGQCFAADTLVLVSRSNSTGDHLRISFHHGLELRAALHPDGSGTQSFPHRGERDI